MSLERCKELAKRHGYDYTDEQLLKIRDFLYQMAAINKIYQKGINKSDPYTRVSSDEQAEKGYSLQYQEEQLRKYCTNRDINSSSTLQKLLSKSLARLIS